MEPLRALHQFWFGEIEVKHSYYEKKASQWFFEKDSEFDLACKEQFSPLLDQFDINELFLDELSAQDYLSLVILFDQIPRNSFRGHAKAFSFDHIALHLCVRALGTPKETELSFPERLFLYLPLEHSEDDIIQEVSVTKYGELYATSPEEIKKWMEMALTRAHEHKKIIEEFGRFPSRDLALGRS